MSSVTAIGFDFGATTIKTGVVQGGSILERGKIIETRQDGNTDGLIQEMIDEIQALKRNHPETKAVGFGVPGIINPITGVVINLTNVKGWKEIPLRSIVHEKTGLTANLENDAKAMAYAEWRHGAGAQVPNVVCVTLGTAVGGALILNGKLYRGASFVAGEIGQMSIDYQGVDYVYGNKGALEAYVGHYKIADRAREIHSAGGIEISDEQSDPKNLSAAADRGDCPHIFVTLDNGKSNLLPIAAAPILGDVTLVGVLVGAADAGVCDAHQDGAVLELRVRGTR